jgi:hypothetical protein
MSAKKLVQSVLGLGPEPGPVTISSYHRGDPLPDHLTREAIEPEDPDGVIFSREVRIEYRPGRPPHVTPIE